MSETHLPIRDVLTHYRDMATLVLDHGIEFSEWDAIPERWQRFVRPMSGACYRQALFLALESRDNPLPGMGKLYYVEGFALRAPETTDDAYAHAWAVNGEGVVFDPTWGAPPGPRPDFDFAYLGLPLDLSWVARTALARRETGCLHLVDPTTVTELVDPDWRNGLPYGERQAS